VRQTALERGGKRADRVWVVRTAPDVRSQEYAAVPELRKGRRYLVGYVGVMGNADGVQYLLEAAGHLVRRLRRTDIQFLLMGTGPEYSTLIERRDQLGLADFVDMPGRVSNEYLFGALRTMDLGVSSDPINSYNHHCTMNKVLEYMTFGKPQVMFDLKEGRASAGDAAVYVPSNSGEQLGEAIGRLLDDPAACARLGRIGAERIRTELNWEKSVAQLEAAYHQAIS
jgi:glycosyltransferase involved in cell wall biosynthesis